MSTAVPAQLGPTVWRRHRALLVFGGILLLTTSYLLLFPTRHFTPDAINNLGYIESHDVFELWHSQHLLGLFPGYGFYQLMAGTLRAWQAVQVANALTGGLTAALVFLTVLLLTRNMRIAVSGALLLWFSYGFWHYQGDPEIYSIGLLGTAVLMLAYVDYMLTPRTAQAARLALAAAFAILTHQLSIEFAGLIGLSMIGSPWWRPNHPNRRLAPQTIHVALYALVIGLVVLAVYFIGWLVVRDYLRQTDQALPSFWDWLLRYFIEARTGQATWGTSLHLDTLPAAGYGLLLSWTLPPLIHDSMARVQVVFLGLFLLGAAIGLLHSPWVLRRLPMPQRSIALVCGLTVATNSFSAWWWQAGNVKFSLFQEIPIVILVALYAYQSRQGARRWVSSLALGMVIVGLVGAHVFFTLPYETQGGLFVVADAAKRTSRAVWFDTAIY
ncbi:MAG TPA: hypothetical protein VMT24_14675, partial [Aggregatilineaceae bacterium]|nr:hypothetical protein [Aggregatilineaceae bacterium]